MHAARPDIDAEAVGKLLLGALGAEYAHALVRAGEAERLRSAIRELVASVLRQP
ncbi:hypothetical protein HLB23_17280 [Nocardia uniformis]|uniref:Uncharacterized protein n=1 Tax=Nocardia uniformis TaxID=53432 RepID=A0A849C9R1_9NOCA|nr:hypothetical protein [Nocardia uniformis]NNH71599.1 hypothetical protein [Nocardia uniformis]